MAIKTNQELAQAVKGAIAESGYKKCNKRIGFSSPFCYGIVENM